jgi:hypothetical protein
LDRMEYFTMSASHSALDGILSTVLVIIVLSKAASFVCDYTTGLQRRNNCFAHLSFSAGLRLLYDLNGYNPLKEQSGTADFEQS